VGVGIGYSHFDRSNGFNEDNLLIPVIVGAEYDVNDHVALTSDMRFNVAATSDVNKFFYTWQILGVRYRF